MPTFPIPAARHELAIAQAQQIASILRDTPDLTFTRPVRGASPAGHEQRLRGIPVQGVRGIGGTVRGTQPLARLIANQPRDTDTETVTLTQTPFGRALREHLRRVA